MGLPIAARTAHEQQNYKNGEKYTKINITTALSREKFPVVQNQKTYIKKTDSTVCIKRALFDVE